MEKFKCTQVGEKQAQGFRRTHLKPDNHTGVVCCCHLEVKINKHPLVLSYSLTTSDPGHLSYVMLEILVLLYFLKYMYSKHTCNPELLPYFACLLAYSFAPAVAIV